MIGKPLFLRRDIWRLYRNTQPEIFSIWLPAGIFDSTLQEMSYVIDVLFFCFRMKKGLRFYGTVDFSFLLTIALKRAVTNWLSCSQLKLNFSVISRYKFGNVINRTNKTGNKINIIKAIHLCQKSRTI